MKNLSQNYHETKLRAGIPNYHHTTNKERTMRVWSVWAGGVEVNDYYLTLEQARVIANIYKDDGYDDVVISAEGAN